MQSHQGFWDTGTAASHMQTVAKLLQEAEEQVLADRLGSCRTKWTLSQYRGPRPRCVPASQRTMLRQIQTAPTAHWPRGPRDSLGEPGLVLLEAVPDIGAES
jgi:hypothetical protein